MFDNDTQTKKIKINSTAETVVIVVVAIAFVFGLIVAAITTNNKSSLQGFNVNTYCDKETNIEYLIYTENSSAITVRYDKNGKVKKCGKSTK